MKQDKNIIAFVMGLRASAVADIRAYEAEVGSKYHILYIQDSKYPVKQNVEGYDELLLVDFSSDAKIAQALQPYENRLRAITCTNDDNIARFARIIPNVPYLRTPTTESLRWATDKYEMRKRFFSYDKTITPKYTWVKENTKAERDRVVAKLGFPMVVKPANLGASLLVTICYHEDELQQALSTGFKKIRKAYQNDKRMEEPKIIAEQFMEGDMYSIDSYVDSRGQVYHCPLVRVRTGKDIGHKDFFGYVQITPTALKPETVERARTVAEKAIHALGLRSCSAHTEMIKIDTDWKVVEVGPRIGGARDVLYDLSCDIKHSLNDVLIRMPKKPVIPKKCKGYAAYVKWFAKTEGVITEMQGIKKLEQLESFHYIRVNKKVGDRSVFASNGGRSVFNLYLYNAERSRLLADIRRLEQMVDVKVARPAVAAKKAAAKKTATKKAAAKKNPAQKVKTASKKTVSKKKA